MSVSITIKNMILDKVRALSSVQSVYGWEELNPNGFPAVFIVTSDLEGEFVSTAENLRYYSFRITIVFPIGKDFIPEAQQDRLDYAEQTIATVVDEIIDAVDTDFELDGSPVIFSDAADAQWGEVQLETGVAKAVQITIRVYTEKRVQ